MNWDGDLYGDVVRVRFLHRIREERKFNSVDDLKLQIANDVRTAERYFNRRGTQHTLSIV
jgi:riboflavin kinase/FMN adenylyltransferase